MRKTAISRGNARLMSGMTPAAVPTAVGVQKTETWLGPPKQNYCHKRDTNLPWSWICFVYHGLCTRTCAFLDDTCAKLVRGPWEIGDVFKVMTLRSNGTTRNNDERSWAPRRLRWHRAT